jgi:hypothetical protein
VPDVAPLDVALLDESTAAQLPSLPSRTSDQRPAAGAQLGTGGTGGTGAQASDVASATGPGPRSPYLDMRRPGAPRIGLPKFEWNPDMAPGPPPPLDPTTGELAPSGNGTYRSDQGPFVARVDRDGNVKIKDKKNFSIHFTLPTPKDIGRAIGDWYMDPNKPIGLLPPEHVGRAPVLTKEEMTGQDKNTERKTNPDAVIVPILGGGFDVTDAFMRGKGSDPYASKKLKFLDATRDERVQIGMRHRTEQLAMAPEIMKRNLDRLWATVGDPAARREALFELWDESAEAGTDELVAAGLAARKLVIGWIRAKLPAGSVAAYTADELAALNQRRTSKAPFAPY